MKYRISYNHYITRWDEAIPLGNGQMGCLLWGSPSELYCSLDRVDVWDTTTPFGTEDEQFKYANLVKLSKEKNTDKIREIFDAPYYCPVPTKLPVGRIIMRFPQAYDIQSVLELDEAQAYLDIIYKTGKTQFRGFIHAEKKIGAFCIELPYSSFEVKLVNPDFGNVNDKKEYHYDAKKRKISQGNLKSLYYELPQHGRKNYSNGSYLEYFTQKISEHFSYSVVMGVKKFSRQTQIFYQVVTSKDGVGFLENALNYVKRQMDCGYESLWSEHVCWWKNYWCESSISIPDIFMEQNWYKSNYLLASCSRKGFYPMPLQGVWTADEDALPPWKGDYHNDLNTQMSYYHYLKANHLKQGECFTDFLWSKKEAAMTFAADFYETIGICLPAVMTIDGKALGGWPMYSLSPTNQIWLCQAFERYYRYTGDESFLEKKAYPYLKETAECIGALLEEGANGYLYLPISSSPEIHDDTQESFLTPNSNYDLALLHYLYQTLIDFAVKLHKEEGKRWREIEEKLPELAMDERKVLKLSPKESLKESHRHFSHAHAIHPLRLIKYDTPEHKAIIDATIEDLEVLGTKMWVGFSFCWMAELYIIAHNGNKAAEQLRIFWKYFCSPNGFHLNGDYTRKEYSTFDYRLFTLESNMCAADALQEMILYMEDSIIEPFPAVPDAWIKERIAFINLRGEGGVLISAVMEKGVLKSLVLEAPVLMRVQIKGWDTLGNRSEESVLNVILQHGKNVFL